MRAWPLLLFLSACGTAAPVAVPIPPLLGHLEVTVAPATALLDVLESGRVDPLTGPWVAAAVPLLAFCADVDPAQVEAELLSAARGEECETAAFTFSLAARSVETSRAQIEAVREQLDQRHEIMLARVQRLLPEEAPEGPPLHVHVVIGLPGDEPAGLAPLGEGRVLLLDARHLALEAFRRAGSFSADALGEALERHVVPELFHVRFEQYVARAPEWRGYSMTGVSRLLFGLLNEGTGICLGLPPEERFDAKGHRGPLADVEARTVLQRFEENLAELTDRATSTPRRERLMATFSSGPLRARWGTYSGALLVDTVLRFGRHGRMREVLRRGPGELLTAYREVCGRFASVPTVSPETAERVRRFSQPAARNREADRSHDRGQPAPDP